MMEVYIEAVGLAAPGMCSWAAAGPVLRGEVPYRAEPLDRYKPTLLPANESRRATDLVRLAFRVCEEATRESAHALEHLAAVFSSSGGDYQIIDRICRALCQPERLVSPTQFHNSVHNAAAGYWSIATRSRAPSTSLSAHDYSFAAGLIEAVTLVTLQRQPTLLAVYDTQPPSPLAAKRPIAMPFAMALLLSPQADAKALGKLTLTACASGQTACASPAMEALRSGNPAARSLPLLELLANRQCGEINLPTSGGQAVNLGLQPC